MAELAWAERWRSFFYPALMSLGVGVLASCAAPPPPAPLQKVAVQPVPPVPPPKPPVPRIVPRPGRKPTPPPPLEAPAADTAGEALAMAEPAPPAPAAPPPRASELVGLDQPAATRLFGRAAEQSEEPPATVWRYRASGCELDLFFYLDLRSGRMRALRYALKGGAGDQSGQQDCLRSLAVAHS